LAIAGIPDLEAQLKKKGTEARCRFLGVAVNPNFNHSRFFDDVDLGYNYSSTTRNHPLPSANKRILSMFHEGDLHSGIGLALQQSKAVLCFIHGEPHSIAGAISANTTRRHRNERSVGSCLGR
jgi:hypothetical protein